MASREKINEVVVKPLQALAGQIFDGPVCIDCGHPMPRRYDHHCDCTTCDVPN